MRHSARTTLVVLSWPNCRLTFRQPATDLSDLSRVKVISGKSPSETSKKRTSRLIRSMGRATTTRPADVIPVPSRLAPPRAERRMTDTGDAIPSGRRERGTQPNRSSRGRRKHPRTNVIDLDGTKERGGQGRERRNLMPTRRRPLLEDPSTPTLPQGMTSSTRQRRQSVTRRGQRSIDRDRSKGMLPNPRTDLRKALGLHPRTQSIGGSARMTRPDRTRTLGQMVPKDRREEAGSPNNIKVQVPTEEETAEPRTAVPTPTHRRPETGPQLLGRGPSRSASHPTEVNLR